MQLGLNLMIRPQDRSDLIRVQAIFASGGYNGAVYEYLAPDLNQLSTGTLPVAVVTDPVGLSLDSRLGLAASTKGAYLSGVSGTYLSSPDSVANSITGDIDIRANLSMNAWVPAANSMVASKNLITGNQFAYDLYITTAGLIVLRTSPDGTVGSLQTGASSVATGFTNYTAHWIRATRNATTGSVIFYTSSDGISWTQLGTTQTTTAGGIFNSTCQLAIGIQSEGTALPIAGKIYSAQIYNGINGTLAVNYSGTDYVTGSTLTSSTTGEVWTLNGAAYIAPDGNHALQATAGARPTWTNWVNLLTYSEDFSNAAWDKMNGATASGNTFTLVNANSYVRQNVSIATKVACTLRFTISSNVPTTLFCGFVDSTDGSDSKEQTINVTTTPIEYTLACDWSASATFSGLAGLHFNRTGLASPTGSTITITNLQFEYGSTATRYQRVNTATDFDTVGFPYYLSFLGTDDSLTSATGGGGSAGFFWCGVVQPTGGAGTLRTLFADNGTNTGYKVQLDTSNKLSYSAGNNTAFTTKVSTATVDVGTKYMLTVWDDGTNLNVQINSAAAETVARPVVVAGTAGFTIGKDNGAASSYSITNQYPPVYFKDTGLTAAQRAAVQSWVKAKAGM